jgi:hypothetical protein
LNRPSAKFSFSHAVWIEKKLKGKGKILTGKSKKMVQEWISLSREGSGLEMKCKKNAEEREKIAGGG